MSRPVSYAVSTPAGLTVKIIQSGATGPRGAPVVFLHSAVGSAAEWRQVFELWPEPHLLIAVDAFAGDHGAGSAGRRTLDDFAEQVLGVAAHLGEPVHLVGFSWGGATALQVGLTRPDILASLTVIEPEAYSILTPTDQPAFAVISALRDRWRDHGRADRWHEAFEEFIDFYNGPGSFATWPAARQTRFLAEQRRRGDLWDVLFQAPLTAPALATMRLPVCVIEGSISSVVDHTICRLIVQHLPQADHRVIDGAGHMIPLTHADALTRVLVDSVTSLSEGGPQPRQVRHDPTSG